MNGGGTRDAPSEDGGGAVRVVMQLVSILSPPMRNT